MIYLMRVIDACEYLDKIRLISRDRQDLRVILFDKYFFKLKLYTKFSKNIE